MTEARVDVVVLTKDSERILERCFDSIFRNVPVNRLIIVDGYSTDSTLKIVKKYQEKHGNVVLIMDKGTRGSARLKGIREVGTEWFAFVDSDVVLCDNWFDKASLHVNGDVGGVWGTEVWDGIQNPKVLKLFLVITRKIFDMRGGTHDLLVRSEAVRDIDIPKDLHVFEDAYIKDWILKKGYRLVATYVPFCLHYRPLSVWTIDGSREILIESLKHVPLRKLPEFVLAYGFYTAYVAYRSMSQKLN